MNEEGYAISVELYKGKSEDPIDTALTRSDDLDMNAALNGTQLAFDKGEADKVAVYIAKDGTLLEIITKPKDSFDVKEMAVRINEIKEKFGE